MGARNAILNPKSSRSANPDKIIGRQMRAQFDPLALPERVWYIAANERLRQEPLRFLPAPLSFRRLVRFVSNYIARVAWDDWWCPVENIAWLIPTAIFFVLMACTLVIMTWLAHAYPEAERVGILRIPTNRGDRLFVSVVAAVVIHLLWIAFFGTAALGTLPIGEEGIEISSLWLATAISLVSAVAIFRTV